ADPVAADPAVAGQEAEGRAAVEELAAGLDREELGAAVGEGVAADLVAADLAAVDRAVADQEVEGPVAAVPVEGAADRAEDLAEVQVGVAEPELGRVENRESG